MKSIRHIFALKKFEYFFLVFILFLATFLRFHMLSSMVGFDVDQEYAANFAWQVVHVYPIQLIGQGLSVQGLFMGPLYFYFLTPFFLLTNLHPIGGYVGASTLGLITILAYFFVLKDVFNKKTAFIATLLQTILFSKISGDWAMAPSYSSELAVLIVWFCCYKYWNGSSSYLVPLFFTLGLFTSFHPILFPLVITVFLILIFRRKIPSIKIVLLAIIAAIIPVSPLLLFEYLRNFLEFKLLFSLQESSKAEPKSLETILTYLKLLFNFPSAVFGITSFKALSTIFSASVYLGLGYAFYKKSDLLKSKFHLLFLVFTILSVFLYYSLLPIHAPEYYFLAIGVIIFIYTCVLLALLLETAKLKFLSYGIILFIVFINFSTITQTWNTNRISLHDKDAIVTEIVKRAPSDNDFNVSVLGDPGWQTGFSYLLNYYDKKPNPTSPESPNYIIVVPLSTSNKKVDIKYGDIGLTLPEK